MPWLSELRVLEPSRDTTEQYNGINKISSLSLSLSLFHIYYTDTQEQHTYTCTHTLYKLCAAAELICTHCMHVAVKAKHNSHSLSPSLSLSLHPLTLLTPSFPLITTQTCMASSRNPSKLHHTTLSLPPKPNFVLQHAREPGFISHNWLSIYYVQLSRRVV